MILWPWKKGAPSAKTIKERESKAHAEALKRAYAISPYLTVSLLGWLAHESTVAEEAGISDFALQRAVKSIAVTMAKLLAKNVVVPTDPAKFAKFVGKHCDHPFIFPGVPDRFAGQSFLSRVTPAEWQALATNFVRPAWLEPAVLQWAQTQRLKLKPQVGQ